MNRSSILLLKKAAVPSTPGLSGLTQRSLKGCSWPKQECRVKLFSTLSESCEWDLRNPV